jgi:hypothetical protein
MQKINSLSSEEDDVKKENIRNHQRLVNRLKRQEYDDEQLDESK